MATVLNITRKSIVYVLVGALVTLPFCATAFAYEGMGEPTPFTTFADALLYRPFGLLLIPIGFTLFIVTLPFSATGGNVKESYDKMVVAPAKFTFTRPLGDIEP